MKALAEEMATVQFTDSTREISPGLSDLQPVEATASIGGLERPLKELIEEVVTTAHDKLPLSDPDESVNGLAERWRHRALIWLKDEMVVAEVSSRQNLRWASTAVVRRSKGITR